MAPPRTLTVIEEASSDWHASRRGQVRCVNPHCGRTLCQITDVEDAGTLAVGIPCGKCGTVTLFRVKDGLVSVFQLRGSPVLTNRS